MKYRFRAQSLLRLNGNYKSKSLPDNSKDRLEEIREVLIIILTAKRSKILIKFKSHFLKRSRHRNRSQGEDLATARTNRPPDLRLTGPPN